MIEGLKVAVKATELKELCLKQAQFHKTRAEQLAKQIHPEQFVYEGEASYDRIRRATVAMLRAVVMLTDHSPDPYYQRAWITCLGELERRGVSE